MHIKELKHKFAIRVIPLAFCDCPVFVLDANEDSGQLITVHNTESIFIAGTMLDDWKEVKPVSALVSKMKRVHQKHSALFNPFL